MYTSVAHAVADGIAENSNSATKNRGRFDPTCIRLPHVPDCFFQYPKYLTISQLEPKDAGKHVHFYEFLTAGKHKLAIEIVGANPKAIKAFMFGLDYVRLRASK